MGRSPGEGNSYPLQCSCLENSMDRHVKSLQSCPTLCNPIDCSLPGSSVHGILQARILEWVAISCSKSESESCSVMSDSLRPHGLYIPRTSSGQNAGVGSCSQPQGIFPTQGSNSGLSHCRWILNQLSHKGIRPGVPQLYHLILLTSD